MSSLIGLSVARLIEWLSTFTAADAQRPHCDFYEWRNFPARLRRFGPNFNEHGATIAPAGTKKAMNARHAGYKIRACFPLPRVLHLERNGRPSEIDR
jgi:hypothetical protein